MIYIYIYPHYIQNFKIFQNDISLFNWIVPIQSLGVAETQVIVSHRVVASIEVDEASMLIETKGCLFGEVTRFPFGCV
jgi:hypothetical protein